MIIEAPQLANIPALWSLWQEAFGDGREFIEVFEKNAFSPERCRAVIDGGNVVAALYWFDCIYLGRKIAYIYAVATAKDQRGRGICRKLMEDTHLHLARLGYAGAILVPGSEKLFDFYERIGYHTCAYISEMKCSASDEKTEIRKISADEYAALRRKLIPQGGVLQENENMRFLQAQAELWRGESFLLAARREGEVLFGLELLGETMKTSAIINTLGCREGRFRIPGGDKAFAMYFPLTDFKEDAPSYFGLAFD